MSISDTKARTVVLVGHCGPDSSFLRMAVSSAAPGTRVAMADSDEELEEALKAGVDLLMLNRVMDWGFAERDGVALLKRIRGRYPDQRVLMVSNFAETQQQAEAAGALPGFGKREIGSARVRERIVAALGQSAAAVS